MSLIAVIKKYNLLRTIVEMDFHAEMSDICKRGTSFCHEMKMLNLDVLSVLEGSSIVLGWFPDKSLRSKMVRATQRQLKALSTSAKADAGSPPSFFTVSLLYIDLLKQVTRTQSILNEKYCDIDPTFGLHDYEVQVAIRNSKDSFFAETFRKVFTKADNLTDYACFQLVESETNARYYSVSHRFAGRPFYQFDNLLTRGEKLQSFVFLDLVVTDEFNEPFCYVSRPV